MAMKQLTDDVIPEQAEFEEEERKTQPEIAATVAQVPIATASSVPAQQKNVDKVFSMLTPGRKSTSHQPPEPQAMPQTVQQSVP